MTIFHSKANNKETLAETRVHSRFNSPTPTRRRIKLSRDVDELVFNPVQFIRRLDCCC